MASILVVDDQSINRKFLAVLLGYAGHTVHEAADGAEALEVVRARRPALVITDVLMPTMDGVEFATRLHADATIAHTPLIFYTATFRVSDARALGAKCGVSKVLAKPSDPQVILDAVGELLGTERVEAPSGATTANEAGLIAGRLPTYLHDLAVLQQSLQRALEQGLELVGESGALRQASDYLVSSFGTVQTLSLRLAALLELGLVLSSQNDPQQLLDMFCRAAQDIMNTRIAALGILDDAGTSVRLWSARGLSEECRARFAAIDARAGLLGRALASDKPQRALLDGDATRAGLFSEHPPIDSVLIVPIRSASTTYGWFYVADKLSGVAFDEQDEQFGVTLAAQLALSYGNLAQRDEIQGHAGRLQIEVAERKRASEVLEKSQQRLALATESARMGVWDWQIESNTLVWDERMYELYGIRAQDFSGAYDAWRKALHPDDVAWAEAEAAAAIAAGTDYYGEFRVVWPHGEVRHIEAHAAVHRSSDGKSTHFTGVSWDITARKRSETALRESEMRFRELAEHLDSVFFLVDPRMNQTLYVSPAYERIWGKSCTSLYDDPASWADVIHPDDRQRVLASDEPSARDAGFDHEYRIVRPDNAVRWIWARGFPVRDESGAIHRIAATAEDITERKEHQNKIARLSRIRAVLSGISSAMLRLRHRDELLQEACRVAATEGVFPMAWAAAPDPRTNTLEVVAAHGGDPAAIDFIRGSARDAVPVQDRPAYRVMRSRKALVVNDLALDPAVAPVREELLRRGFRSGAAFPLFVDGEIAAVLVLLAGERDFFDAEEIALLDWLASDLSFALDHIAKSERLNFLAYYDALTGLPNAALFVDRVGQYVHAAGQAGDRIAVILIDMLRFRAVNDEHGRQVGDIVLNMIAERLSAALPEACTLARIGADKFAVAKSGDADAAAALIHDTVLAVLGKPFQHDGKEIRLAAKAGIAVFPTDGLDAETLLTRAEAALEQAKSSTEPFQFYAREVNVRIAEKLALEEQLRSAVAGGQFVVHYQPRVDLTSGELVGAEALIRWQHPDRGLVAPGEFIGLAEATGLIVPIGSWVIDAVCAQQAAWSAAGIGIVPVAVNLSSVQFEKGDLLQTVRAALTKHALDPRQLDLELTESAVMGDPAAAAKTLQAVRKLGVGLALDDFGTGYSSLAHLKRFPFDLVKIDQSFIADITSNIEDAAIATAIIAMAHRLQLKVVAEGVETQGQCNYLRAQGCDQLQGHFFSPAVAAEAFELLLRSGKRMSLSAPDPADQRTLLVLDDEQGIRAALNRVLRRDGYKILSAASPSEAFDLLAINRVQVVVSDQRMPEMSGTAFLQTVAQLYPDTVRIILSGYTDLEVVTDSVNRGSVFKFLTKPWDDDLLRAQVRDAFRRYRPERA